MSREEEAKTRVPVPIARTCVEGADSHRQLVGLAWDEMKAVVGRSRTADGFHDRGSSAPPPLWFTVCELGEGVCKCARCLADGGASLSKTFAAWRGRNRDVLDYLYSPPPMPGSVPRELPPGEALDFFIARLRAAREA